MDSIDGVATVLDIGLKKRKNELDRFFCKTTTYDFVGERVSRRPDVLQGIALYVVVSAFDCTWLCPLSKCCRGTFLGNLT